MLEQERPKIILLDELDKLGRQHRENHDSSCTYQLRKKRKDAIYGSSDEQAPSILTVSSHMAINPAAPAVEPPTELESSCEVPAPPAADVVDPLLELPEEITFVAHT